MRSCGSVGCYAGEAPEEEDLCLEPPQALEESRLALPRPRLPSASRRHGDALGPVGAHPESLVTKAPPPPHLGEGGG